MSATQSSQAGEAPRGTGTGTPGRSRYGLYEVLQVSPHAVPEVIHASYRALARRYHPDLNGEPEAAARMRELNSAYAVLGDSRRRAEYDAARGWLRRSPIYAAPQRKSNGTLTVAPLVVQPALVSRPRIILLLIALLATLTLLGWLLVEILADSSMSLFLAAASLHVAL